MVNKPINIEESLLNSKGIKDHEVIKNNKVSESTFSLIDSIIETKNYISSESLGEVNIKVKSNHDVESKGVSIEDTDAILLENSLVYTTYSYTKGNITIGVIIIYNTFIKEFRTITTTKYVHNHLHVIGYLKTLEYARECNINALKIYTDNEMPNLLNKNIIDTWLSINCMVNGKVMPIRPYVHSIKTLSLEFKKEPITRKVNIENNKLMLLLKNIAVKIALNILSEIKGDYKLKTKRIELDIEIARLSLVVFSKPIILFESNDIDFER